MMTMEAIQNEVAMWPEDAVRRLQGFLVSMAHQRDGRLERFSARLNDSPAEQWVPLEEVEAKLGLGDHDDEL